MGAPDGATAVSPGDDGDAVVTDGTAVLGLGDIGPAAAMPVMEGKCALFKEFAGVDAFPICINSKDPRVIVDTVKLISTVFGGINLEDIAAPRCFQYGFTAAAFVAGDDGTLWITCGDFTGSRIDERPGFLRQ